MEAEGTFKMKPPLKTLAGELTRAVARYTPRLFRVNGPDMDALGKLKAESFIRLYTAVCTRNFKLADTGQAVMVPLADQMNHRDISVGYEMVNKRL